MTIPAFDARWQARVKEHKAEARPNRYFDYGRLRHTKRYKPRVILTLDDFKYEMLRILGDKAGIFSDYRKRRFFTFGSCFATNVSAYLSEIGAQSRTTTITEDVNSPINNVLLLRRVLCGEESEVTREFSCTDGVDYDEIHDSMRSATDIIFTLGNVFYLWADGRNVIGHTTGSELREQSFEEVRECIYTVLKLLHERTSARIFVTVSPVPISGYRGTRYASAMEADCASKSRLRAALSDIEQQLFSYLPLFEVFKWLAPHQEFRTFGNEDGSSRHIGRDQIKIVMEALTT